MSIEYDAVVVGAGPNGLGAAITLARVGCSVLVVEAAGTPGGGARSAQLTLPGFVHDVCSAVHPMAFASPLFRQLHLEQEGLGWVQPPVPLAHPFGGARATALYRSIDETVDRLGGDEAYRMLMEPLAVNWSPLVADILRPLSAPRHPLLALRFGWRAIRSASKLVRNRLNNPAARALLGGISLHAGMPLDRRPTAAFGLVLGALGHAVGWPIVKGGTQRLTDALVSRLQSLGGRLVTGFRVEHIDQLPRATAYFFDTSPRALVRIAGHRFPDSYRRRLENFRYGQGVCKVDFAVDQPPPWTATVCRRAGTVHLGGSLEALERSERAVWRGEHPSRPFIILSQPTVFDPSRAPPGRHCVWAYCHVPAGSNLDCSEMIEREIEHYAPGFRDTVLARSVRTAAALEAYDPNFIGGDINGGAQDLRQLFTRPVSGIAPYATPDPSIFMCSSATPPGGSVHGLCGYYAVREAVRRLGRDALARSGERHRHDVAAERMSEAAH